VGTCPHNYQRRRSCVNFRGHDIFARKICMKIIKMPEFYMILPENAMQILRNNCPKNICSRFFFWGGGYMPPLPPVSYAYDNYAHPILPRPRWVCDLQKKFGNVFREGEWGGGGGERFSSADRVRSLYLALGTSPPKLHQGSAPEPSWGTYGPPCPQTLAAPRSQLARASGPVWRVQCETSQSHHPDK